jgi:hypothetical protein
MPDKRTRYPDRLEEKRSYGLMAAARVQAETSRAETNNIRTCDTAFLAERGCFTQAESTSQAAPALQHHDRIVQDPVDAITVSGRIRAR